MSHISRILSTLIAQSLTIIPLGPGSLRDSSSLPEGRDAALLRARRVRAGPALPSYLALLHAGFSMPRMLPSGRWALTPPFHPYQMRSVRNWPSRGVTKRRSPRSKLTGGIFSVALSVAVGRSALARFAARPPDVIRRVALSSRAFAEEPGVRTFLPLTWHNHFWLCAETQAGDHPAHPLSQL